MSQLARLATDGWINEKASAQPIVETLVKPRLGPYLDMPYLSVKPLLSKIPGV